MSNIDKIRENLEINIQTPINPTEESRKVIRAVENVFPNQQYIIKDNKVILSSNTLEVLKKIKEQIRSRYTFGVLKKCCLTITNMILHGFC